MNNAVFGDTMENAKKNRDIKHVRKHRYIKHVTTKRRRNYLVSEPNCHTTKFLTENLLAKEMRKREIPMNKLVYLVLSML